MATADKSSADFRREATGIPTLVKANGATVHPAQPDPMQQAWDDVRKRAAMGVYESADAESEARTLEHRLAAKKAEIELRELEQPSRPSSGGGSDEWRDFLMHQLDDVREALAEAKREAHAADVALHEQEITMLREKLAEVSQARGDVAPVDPLMALVSTLDTVKALRERLGSDTPPAATPIVVDDLRWKAMEKQLEQQMLFQKIQADREENEARRKHDLLLLEIQRREDRADKEASAGARFFEQYAPAITEFLKPFGPAIAGMIMRGASGGVAAAGNVAPSPLPEGLKEAPCDKCKKMIRYAPQAGVATCWHCGAVFRLNPETPTGEEGQDEPVGTMDDSEK